jgi:hypothetical protein
MSKNQWNAFVPEAFVDDDPMKQQIIIHDVRVMGNDTPMNSRQDRER